MSRYSDYDGPDNRDFDDEFDDVDSMVDADDEEESLVPCPHCRRMLPETCDHCPYCSQWIVTGVSGPPGWVRRMGIVILVTLLVLGLLALLTLRRFW